MDTRPCPAEHAGRRGDPERGSAMIIALLIMIILTLLGVTFLVLSEQEERISVNQRDHAQTLYVAEAAVEVAKSWFNDPRVQNPLKPSPLVMNRDLRRGAILKEGYTNDQERSTTPANHFQVNASQGNRYTGGVAGSGGALLFEKPYRGDYAWGLWGRPNTPDVLICGDPVLDVDGNGSPDCVVDVGGQSNSYLNALNNALLLSPTLRSPTGDNHSPRDLGTVQVQQIRVYRPPLDFTLLTRYGIATVEATAVKRLAGRIVSTRTVREVIQEIPFPGPGGVIDTEGSVTQSGSSGIHWGQVASASNTGNIDLPNTNSNNFPDPAFPRTGSGRWGFHFTFNPAAFTDLTANVGVATALTEMLGITRNGAQQGAWTPPFVPDPWLIFRARNVVVGMGGGDQPHPYGNGNTLNGSVGGGELDNNSDQNWSHMFQNQAVRFPKIDYDTWKEIARTGQPGMYYFQHVSGTLYRRDGRGLARDWLLWATVPAGNPAGNPTSPGVYFFDTTNAMRPLDLNPTNLTPPHGWAPGRYFEGFLYLNSTQLASSGSGNGRIVDAIMPGEPFLDDGIDLHDSTQMAGDDCICIRYDVEDGCVVGIRPIRAPGCPPAATQGDSCNCSFALLQAMDPLVAAREAATYRNGVWDSDINNDGVSDAGTALTSYTGTPGWSLFTANANANGTGGHGFANGQLPHYPGGRRFDQGFDTIAGGAGDYIGADWMRDPRFLNNLAAIGGVASQRQAHEPFLNLDYPTNGTVIPSWGGQHGVKLDYQATGDVSDNTVTPNVFTTRARDAAGGMLKLPDIGINGIAYNHGSYGGTGNIKIYGSFIMKTGYDSGGSVDIWFNEGLIRGDFPPAAWNLPRVFATARNTE